MSQTHPYSDIYNQYFLGRSQFICINSEILMSV